MSSIHKIAYFSQLMQTRLVIELHRHQLLPTASEPVATLVSPDRSAEWSARLVAADGSTLARVEGRESAAEALALLIETHSGGTQ